MRSWRDGTPEEQAAAIEIARQRKAAYQLAFSAASGTAVLRDLEAFCRGRRTCFHPDPRVHAALEGRREVLLRINEHLDAEPEQLLDLYGAVLPEKKGDQDDE